MVTKQMVNKAMSASKHLGKEETDKRNQSEDYGEFKLNRNILEKLTHKIINEIIKTGKENRSNSAHASHCKRNESQAKRKLSETFHVEKRQRAKAQLRKQMRGYLADSNRHGRHCKKQRRKALVQLFHRKQNSRNRCARGK